MGDIKIVASGVCKKCGHSQPYHQDNTGCKYEGCDCTANGSY